MVSDTPCFDACTAVAAADRFSFREIFATPNFLRASDFKMRLSSAVQARRATFFLAANSTLLFLGAALLAHVLNLSTVQIRR
jgi:hypothetical protein